MGSSLKVIRPEDITPQVIRPGCKVCFMNATKVPVVEVPIIGYPMPVRLQGTFGLCDRHAAAFTLDMFTDYAGAWYDMVCDQLRAMKKPAVCPYQDKDHTAPDYDPVFVKNWDSWIVDPDWHAAPKMECELTMCDIRLFQGAKGMRQDLW